MSDRVGLRELRQQASELVRRAEAGEDIIITVAGRPAAQLGSMPRRRWRVGREIRHVFETPTDPTWAQERSTGLDSDVRDPWP